MSAPRLQVNVRLDPATHARWQAGAERLGVDLTTMVRDAVDAYLAAAPSSEDFERLGREVVAAVLRLAR